MQVAFESTSQNAFHLYFFSTVDMDNHWLSFLKGRHFNSIMTWNSD